MPRRNRYTHTLAVYTSAIVDDGYGGKKAGTPAVVCASYSCLLWSPSVIKVQLIRTEYGLTDTSFVFYANGPVDTSIHDGMICIDGDGVNYKVLNVIPVIGKLGMQVAQSLVLEKLHT